MSERAGTLSLQPMQENSFDAVILGGGLGGLLSAVILAKAGMNVCVLEKNRQVGGSLQSFAFQKTAFDSCVHYIGGLKEGHSLHQIFRYAGIMEGLKLHELREEGFDQILFGEEQNSYPIAGRAHFVEHLMPYFPKEKAVMEAYLEDIYQTASQFSLYFLRQGNSEGKIASMSLTMTGHLRALGASERLLQVLLGNNLLYSGVADVTPFYVHALSTDGYLHSAHKVLPASSQIAKLLWRELQQQGGVIYRHVAVSRLHEGAGGIEYAEASDGRRFYGRHFISSIHPSMLIQMLDGSGLRPSFIHRIQALPQTPSGMMINLVLRPGAYHYEACNIYWHPSGDSLARPSAEGLIWPDTQALFFSEDEKRPGYAATVSILVYARLEDYAAWQDTENIIGVQHRRSEDYEAFKEAQADCILKKTFARFPGLKAAVSAQSVATPLSFRDYTGTRDGSLYGPLKDATHPARNIMAARTRIPNLLLTGQNLNMHGVMGVSVSAVATCSELLGMDYLLQQIREA
ncbi:MAG: NAD(P)/FAD-dependent oxidoreductase [Bacteroidetes bacterium]|nr:NAD(P)/FAD-dependent oxidoreductase [Bacteroidota bacterium]MBS1628865.1 NAD(P)/FAD-dependent oxidoreductase [Bacteroidota bacterium]